MKYKPTIGLEIHAELKTKTKMFCDSPNVPLEKEPNVNVCPICMGHPGTLPVINKEAVRKVLLVGKAIGGKLADYSKFNRKNYFYPDLPKGYQISQYKDPLVSGGKLNGVQITRVHLEEDTGKLVHGSSASETSLVDFNRAGIPLMELVTEPCIKSGVEAKKFGEEFQLLLRYLGVSDADMEKGLMRVEVNISLGRGASKLGLNQSEGLVDQTDLSHKSVLGTKVEIKNLNSFRAVEKSVEYEIKRQTDILSKGEKVVQETRGWDEDKQKTFSQRDKEEAHDYRYFPEPDLPDMDIRSLKSGLGKLPELPWEKRKRYGSFGIKDEDVESYVVNAELGTFFENVVNGLGGKASKLIKLASNYITSDLVGLQQNVEYLALNKLAPENFAELIRMINDGTISSRGAKDILKIMVEKRGTPQEIAEKENLLQKSDEGELKEIIQAVMNSNPSAVSDYKKGKETALKFLIGQVMKASKGSANPQITEKVLKEMI